MIQTASGQTTKRGLVVSDLHLFARRSQGAARFKSLRAKLEVADILVLNGDIFDFRWSTLPNHAATVAAAIGWLGELVNSYPRCQVHFVHGNHDCLIPFRHALLDLTSSLSRLQCHDHELRLGSALFLHGDCADDQMDVSGLRQRRARWEDDPQRGALASSAYIVADRLGLTRRTHKLAFPQERTVRRVAHYLDHASSDWRQEIRDCYFGHTHLPFSGHHHDGVAFHNTGSAIHVQGLDFNPISFEVRA